MGGPVYLYGLVRASADGVRPNRSGVSGGGVRVLESGALGALVSDLDSIDYRARRDDLVAHSDVLQEVVDATAVLPIGFGTVFASAAELESAFLQPNHDALVRMLDELDSSVEIQVKGEYDEDAIAREIATDRSVRKLQMRARSRGDVESRIELGRRFAGILEDRRRRDGRAIVNLVAPLAREVSVSEPPGEYGLVNASFLVPRGDVDRVGKVLDGVGETVAGRATLRCLGPLPPYSFVDASELVTR